jgi:acetolactate synthase-1/2/3 large subunit
MPKERVADIVAQWISDSLGQKYVFMVTGAGIMHLTDGVAKNPHLEGLCLHHEQSVSMAVDAFSKVSQSLGVAYVSTGPGSTNAVTGVAGAWQDSVACLFIGGQAKTSEAASQSGISGLRQYGVQELDTIPIFESITKYCRIVTDPNNVLFELEKATYLALSGRPGPVWLEIPMNVQSALVDTEALPRFMESQDDELGWWSETEPEKLRSFVEDLAISKRPVFIVGHGVRLSDSISELRKFAQKWQIPITSTYLGVDSTQPHDDRYIGKIGVKGERAANIAVQKADFLVALGTSLHVSAVGYNYDEFAPSAKKWVVDIDRTSHEKNTISDFILLEKDLSGFFPALDAELSALEESPNAWGEWAEILQRMKRDFPTVRPEYEDDSEGINIYKVVEIICEAAGDSDVFVSDAGSAYYAVTQAVDLRTASQRYVTSGAMATMGYSVPAAIGAALATPTSRVWAFTGDGSFFQNVQELGQIAYLNLNIVVLVLNNDGYLSIRNSQKNYFQRRFIGTDQKSGLGLPSIVDISRAFELPSYRIDTIAELRDFLMAPLAEAGPLLLDVRCPPGQEILPNVSSKLLEDGTMVSRSLHDMDPLLEPELLKQIMRDDWGFRLAQ